MHVLHDNARHFNYPSMTLESSDIIAERGYKLKDEIENDIIFLRSNDSKR